MDINSIAVSGRSPVAIACPYISIDGDALRLRLVDSTDRAFLQRVYAQSRADEMAKVSHWSDVQKAEFLRFQFDAQDAHYRAHYPDAEFWVVQWHKQDIGRLYLHHSEDDIRVMDIALLSPLRGQGFGSQLMQWILSMAERQNKSVSLHVEPENPAKRLYLSLGFEVCGEISFYQRMCWLPN
ncbi:GNAT family N-acetyltransferase [Aliiglaciecola sp. CAU 1673]|uniref:GNAT family N-acetyltransferase n=1 Tax=Aliiglaciecola sp. CAU 1673 TaxID=3032595 RepID=UPI0023DA9D65|nr:GNAT family N-acetyltransferase [Aliiglaciecola sp. CAU 1673]MDF2178069.1 GNAT family N-acetyltransferase [Aliiglaciecola sp. CAU 1673]